MTKPQEEDLSFERIAELDAADASDKLAAKKPFVFRPEKIDDTLVQCDKLIACYQKQIALMGELKRSLVHECGKHLDDPKARAAFIRIKLAELAARNVTVDERGRLKSLKSQYPRVLQWAPELEHIAKDIQRARAYDTPAPAAPQESTDG